MPKTTSFAGSVLDLILNGVAITGIAENHSTPAVNLYISLHTASPGLTGNQSTNECAYTDYTRRAIARSGAGFDLDDAVASFATDQDFTEYGGGGAETATHFGIGSDATGTGTLYMYGELDPDISIDTGVSPRLLGGTSGTTITES